ncbi:MAG: tRNA uridine-5-carboxymethylaminomethyl(34) synthesis enzyme MnmG [Christensenellaceae bacterium]|nr:tRNA uridine-5-carboxymethylaminomethyl(34) synthesis enzyme MnmG [Christensenellaceae bacterium]
MENNFDAVVIGSGHAGSEACLAISRLGHKTLLLTMNLDSIAFLACNPSIGGTAKGQLVSEIDALGGQMGINADKTILQLRMLNLGKGAAVHSLRAQVDKNKYHASMKQTLEAAPNLFIKQAEAVEILTKDDIVLGVKTACGEVINCNSIVVATGVYLDSRVIIGEYTKNQGPNGFLNAVGLSDSLKKLGFEILRFKTGTPARVHGASIDFGSFEEQNGDNDIQTFSYLTKKSPPNVCKCYLGYTNQNTHNIIKANLHRSPLYAGMIKGVGPRYCPSIEDKVVRFADKERHQIFLEPEALDSYEIYVQGFSSSLPIDVQQKMYSSVKGFENVQIMRYAYAIEYDCINSLSLKPSLEAKHIKGLFFAGQINGTSGYEEGAAQGLIAGINSVMHLEDKKPLVLGRDQAYIGVLIDDLVTKGTNEPYRMMTSRAEYRLHLRQDNADIRLTEIGRKIGLVDDIRYKLLLKKKKQIEKANKELKTVVPMGIASEFLKKHNESPTKQGITIKDLIKRSNISAHDILELGFLTKYPKAVVEHINIETKYEGFLTKEAENIERMKQSEKAALDPVFDYSAIKGLRTEAFLKLNKIKPINLGQAMRISGVSPADIAVLMVYIKAKKQNNH